MLRTVLCLLLFITLPAKRYELYNWEEGKQLTWADYHGKADRLSPYAATTNSGISHRFAIDQNGLFIKKESVVKACFYPTLSWYKPKLVNPGILKHEQTHFDISELHARILRKRIANFRFTKSSKSEIKKIYKDVEHERQVMQAIFDRETNHSRNLQAENRWEIKIEKLLQDYAFWKG